MHTQYRKKIEKKRKKERKNVIEEVIEIIKHQIQNDQKTKKSLFMKKRNFTKKISRQ